MSNPPKRKNIAADVSAGLVVFLVAVPLCLGIAQASGAPLLSGLIAGIMGGLVVSIVSRSELSVSGPAAGLAVIVANGIEGLGFRHFLLAVVIGGAIQMLMGVLKLGRIAHFFPASVIKGMLAAIGVLIILKQIPHAIGYDADYEGDTSFFQEDGANTFTAIADAFGAVDITIIGITLACVAMLVAWGRIQKLAGFLKFIPGPLMVVVTGALGALLAPSLFGVKPLLDEHLVALPIFNSVGAVADSIVVPELTAAFDPAVWKLGVTLAIVASIETLLSLEAVDRLDPHRRISPPNRELIAQGTGNMLSGAIGGLPLTAVIVRSSANVVAGAETRLSAFVHGILLLLGVLFFGTVLNTIPLAALAVVLIGVGLKLTSRQLWMTMWKGGWVQFIPFSLTVAAVVFTDLLTGTLFGLVVGVIVTLREQRKNSIVMAREDDRVAIRATKDLTFLEKAQVKEVLGSVPEGARVLFDLRNAEYIHPDIQELFEEFEEHCDERNVKLEWKRREEPPSIQLPPASVEGVA
ncbi:MAG: SulP family inorganic anion transporter [Deltaproteobacteria bacterium]